MFLFGLQPGCCKSALTLSSTATALLQAFATVMQSCPACLILSQYFGKIFALVILAPERNMAERFGCIPQLLCGSALHLTLY